MRHVASLIVFLAAIGYSHRETGGQERPPPTQAERALVKQAEAQRVSVVAGVYGAVVAIYGNDREGGGSGVLINRTGLALTNHHVVAAAGPQGWGGLADGRLYRWRLVGTDPGGDVALVQLEGRESFPCVPLGNSRQVRVGDTALALGNPFTLADDQRPTLTLGIVSGVDRYQFGASGNTLVYGRCLQVDSSINPGNSGGPLFNARGQLIGINGRASFEERGRVNVGAGYAISLEQCLNFLPDLLSTKLAQHGTLDAQFGDREAGVICHTLNLDSEAARAGLQLSDRLLEFEGESIRSGNQFTNLVSTLPAHWPAALVVERQGARVPLHVRLAPLEYEAETPVARPQPEVPPNGEQEEKPAPKPSPQPAAPQREPLGTPGQIRQPQQNAAWAAWLLNEARRELGFGSPPNGIQGVRLSDGVWQADREVGRAELIVAVDGRFVQRITIANREQACGYDGTSYWRSTPDGVQRQALPRLAVDPLASQALVLASLMRPQPAAAWQAVELAGSDKAGGKLCYRVRLSLAQGRELFVWLRVVSENGQLGFHPVKIGPSLNAESPLEGVVFDAWQSHQGIWLPGQRWMAEGLRERQVLELRPLERSLLPTLEPGIFELPNQRAEP